MKRSKHASILARYLIITAGILLAAGYIAYCTFKNTVLHANKWNERAHIELSRSSRVIPPERGDILASDGTVLATTLQYYTLRIDFGSEAFKWQRYADALDSLADAFDRHFPIAVSRRGRIRSVRLCAAARSRVAGDSSRISHTPIIS